MSKDATPRRTAALVAAVAIVVAAAVAAAQAQAPRGEAQTPGFTVYVDGVADGGVGDVQTSASVTQSGLHKAEIEVQGLTGGGLAGYNVTLNWSPAANLTTAPAKIIDKTGFVQVVRTAGVGTLTAAFTNLDDITCTNPLAGGAGEGATSAVLMEVEFTAVSPGLTTLSFDTAVTEIALCDTSTVAPDHFDGASISVQGTPTVTPTHTITPTVEPTLTPVPTATYTPGPIPYPDLNVTKIDLADPVGGGDPISYEVLVRNLGPAAAQDVLVYDVIDPATTLVSFSPAPPCFQLIGGIACGFLMLAANDGQPGGPDELTISVTVQTAQIYQDIVATNRAGAIASNELAATENDNEAVETTAVIAPPAPDLVVTKASQPAKAETRAAVIYRLDIRNIGPGVAQNVVITDSLPADAVFVGPAPCVAAPGNQVVCNIATIAANDALPGGPDEVTILLQVLMPRAKRDVTVTNQVGATLSNEPPTTLGDNAASATTAVIGCPDVNGDGKVGLPDVTQVSLYWNVFSTDPRWQADVDPANGVPDGQERDVNADNKVGLLDVVRIALWWNRICPT